METLEIRSESELQNVAKRVLEMLVRKKQDNAATVLALSGDLGAGKTTFTQVLAQELGITEAVTSPTFVVLKVYESTDQKQPFTRLAHIDAYRIDDVDEMRVLRFGELLTQNDTIICIEWAEKIASLLPAHTVWMRMEIEGQKRRITFTK